MGPAHSGVLVEPMESSENPTRQQTWEQLSKLPNLECPNCGYSMVGLPTPICSECGHRGLLSEFAMRRKHRSKSWAEQVRGMIRTLAILAFVGGAIWMCLGTIPRSSRVLSGLFQYNRTAILLGAVLWGVFAFPAAGVLLMFSSQAQVHGMQMRKWIIEAIAAASAISTLAIFIGIFTAVAKLMR